MRCATCDRQWKPVTIFDVHDCQGDKAKQPSAMDSFEYPTPDDGVIWSCFHCDEPITSPEAICADQHGEEQFSYWREEPQFAFCSWSCRLDNDVPEQLLANQESQEISYRCEDNGYGVEEGAATGFFTGEIDVNGKATFVDLFAADPDERYLVLSRDEVTEHSGALPWPNPQAPLLTIKAGHAMRGTFDPQPSKASPGKSQGIWYGFHIDDPGHEAHGKTVLVVTDAVVSYEGRLPWPS